MSVVDDWIFLYVSGETVLTVINAFWEIALFRRGPEELPSSQILLSFAILSYLVVNGLGASLVGASPVLVPVVDLLLLGAAGAGLLFAAGYPQRLRQMLTALCGADAVVQFISLPFSAMMASSPSLLSTIALVVLLLWSLAVYGSIFSRAVSQSFGIGIAITVVYFVMRFQIISGFIPAT